MMNYKILSTFIKDVSFEIPNVQTFVMLSKEIKNFLVIGIINKKPTISVKNPGIINNKAANANAAPDMIS